MLKKFFRFLSEVTGNVTIIFALGGIPMIAAIGAAVDYGRASASNAVIQAAADAAAIAAAADPKISDAKMTEIVNSYLVANGVDKAVVKISKVEVNADKKTGTVGVKVSGQFNTSLMNLVGISSLEIGGISEVQTGGQALEVALVLDNTFSMSEQGRLDGLKVAAHAMINQLFAANGGTADVKASIVPFADYVNVGMSHRNESWLDVPADTSKTEAHNVWVPSNCKNVPVDGVTGAVRQECVWTETAAQQTYTIDYKWEGCVGSRSAALDTRIDALSTHYVGLLDNDQQGWHNVACGQAVTPLTSNASKLNADISSMDVTHDQSGQLYTDTDISEAPQTYIPAGLLWGWNMLDENVPFTEGKSKSALADVRGSKALVLMTDGDNTLSPYDYPWHVESPFDPATGFDPNWGSIADQKTAELCENIKAAGITIYTVSLKVTKPASLQMLENCASSPTLAFNADDNTALLAAFKQIADTMMAVHITR